MMPAPILLLTRPAAQSRAFAQTCRAAGFDGAITVSPIIDIRPVPIGAAPDPGTALLFTSANGVRAAASQADLRGFRAWAVGDKTAQVARDYGIACDAAGGSVDDLIALVLADRPAMPLLHLRGAHSTGDLAGRLAQAGMTASAAVVYDQAVMPLSEGALGCLRGAAPVILPLFSPRSAVALSHQVGDVTAPLHPIAISANAAAAWAGPGRMTIIGRPDGTEMALGIVDLAEWLASGSGLVGRGVKS